MNRTLNALATTTLLLLGILLASCASLPADAPVPEADAADIRQARLLLPGAAEERLVTFEVIDCQAVFEGDILLGDTCSGSLEAQGVAQKDGGFRWPNGTIPFRINSSLNATMQGRVQDAMDHWEANTDIRFVARTTQTDFVEFTFSSTLCASNVGRQGGQQNILLTNTCPTGSIIHEIGHAVGLFHEQSRSDRDEHVTILWDNIQEGKKFNFEIADDGVDLGEYDHGSIMHYPATAFCIRDARGNCVGSTILTIPAGIAIGQRVGLSDGDIASVRRLYPPEQMAWHQNSSSVLEASELADRFGYAVASGDFDGDGFLDLAVGVPGESVGSVTGAGAVNVFYGGADGLNAARDQLWHQDSSGVNGTAESGDRFGEALAAGDFNGDGRDDLAIGVPGEAIGSISGAGLVNVLYGTSSGLSGSGDQDWHQDTSGVNDLAEIGDKFGEALAAGDFDGDGFDDLAIGVPGEALGSLLGAGAVNVLYGSSSKLTSSGDQDWHQDTSGVNGTAEIGDKFGEALAAGDFDGDGFDDLAIGVPGEGIGSIGGAGAVNVLYGSSSKLTSSGDQDWHQNTSGVNGTAESGDRFGEALAAGDFDGDGFDDLAIGVPGEGIGSRAGAGGVNVLFGSSGSGLSVNGDQFWHQDYVDPVAVEVAGGAEVNDAFGAALAAGDFNGDGRADLAVGAPTEAIGSISNAGMVNMIYYFTN